MDNKIIIREISLLQFLLMTTSKLLIGIGLGLIIATNFWYAQPYWFLLIIIGAIILLPTLYSLMRIEGKKEISLIKKVKRK
jgi:hypothetical protein